MPAGDFPQQFMGENGNHSAHKAQNGSKTENDSLN
jgi:hypothetical protein